jgi:thrombospondin type 3 repeat protein
MTQIHRVSILACFVAALIAAESPAQVGASTWPANVRVNQDSTGNPQAEATLAVDPRDPLHLVAVFWEVISYDPANPGNRQKRLNWAWSRDGGLTWQSRRFENDVYSSDPSIVADRDGNFYIETILVPQFPYDTGSSIGILKSTDGGETFVKTADIGLDRSMDVPKMTIDPASGALYVVWTDFDARRGPNAVRVFFSASTDHGATFTAPQQISNPNSFGGFQTAGVGTEGEIYVTWSSNGATERIWLTRSLDGGTTWSKNDVRVTDVPYGGGNALIWPTIAVDRSGGPHHGRIYVAWSRYADGLGFAELAWSDDRGDHWSQPTRVDPFERPGDTHNLAWVVVDDHGRVYVTYQLWRPDPAGMLRGEYLAASTDGGATFGPNIRISDGLYLFKHFASDYDEPAIGGNRLHAIWPDARFGDNDVFTQSIDLDDFDEDGVLNDGDHRCTGGATAHCDDNCPGTPNPDQADADGDLIGDACDNCPATPNADQSDLNGDGIGDACQSATAAGIKAGPWTIPSADRDLR